MVLKREFGIHTLKPKLGRSNLPHQTWENTFVTFTHIVQIALHVLDGKERNGPEICCVGARRWDSKWRLERSKRPRWLSMYVTWRQAFALYALRNLASCPWSSISLVWLKPPFVSKLFLFVMIIFKITTVCQYLFQDHYCDFYFQIIFVNYLQIFFVIC